MYSGKRRGGVFISDVAHYFTLYLMISFLLLFTHARYGGQFLHLGGDEVPTACWEGSAKVMSWMKAHGIQSADELESYFVNKYDGSFHFDRNNGIAKN